MSLFLYRVHITHCLLHQTNEINKSYFSPAPAIYVGESFGTNLWWWTPISQCHCFGFLVHLKLGWLYKLKIQLEFLLTIVTWRNVLQYIYEPYIFSDYEFGIYRQFIAIKYIHVVLMIFWPFQNMSCDKILYFDTPTPYRFQLEPAAECHMAVYGPITIGPHKCEKICWLAANQQTRIHS